MGYGTLVTPQGEAIPGRDQEKNSAGGYVFTVDHWTRLHRFLVLGSDSGTYYVSDRKLTVDNANSVLACLKDDGQRTVDMAVEVSIEGRAPKNDQAIFVMAMALSFGEAVPSPDKHSVSASRYWYETQIRQYAADKVPFVCRIGTHIFQLVSFLKNMGGMGSVKRQAIQNWFNSKSDDELAYQFIKYRMREGWNQHDLAHVVHPKPKSEVQDALFHWVKEQHHEIPKVAKQSLPRIVSGFELAQNCTNPKQLVNIIQDYKLPHEAIPTEFKNHPAVQEALLAHMPIGALVRNLGNFSKSGLLAPLSDAEKLVVDKLSSEDQIQRSRIHPLGVLLALRTYGSGHGFKGTGTWTPSQPVLAALENSFYTAFGNVVPIGNNVMLALDVSGSMEGNKIAGSNLSAREASCAMAMVTVRTEASWMMTAFSTQFGILPMSPTESLEALVTRTARLPFGGTDCSLPMVAAAQNEIPVDTFIVYTDNETWAGRIHPNQALAQYRKKMSRPNAKLVVVGLTATNFSIADPNDSGMLDVVGFDTAAPNIISDFCRDS